MTDEIIALRGLMEKNADADPVREMIGLAAERLMELEVGGLCPSKSGGRSAVRVAVRTAGCCSCGWHV